MLAPNAPLRPAATAYGRDAGTCLPAATACGFTARCRGAQ